MTKAAYLIGVPEYHAEEFKNLPAVRNDLARMTTALKSSDYTVLSHSDKPIELSRSLILATLRKIARASTADLLLVYFSGHGVHFEDGRDYMVPYDAPSDDEQIPDYLISWDDLASALDDAKASTILLVADVCREGVGTEANTDSKGLAPFSKIKAERVRNRTIIRIYSCAPATLSWVSRGKDGLSHFTEAFAEAMDASSPPRYPQEILDYTQKRLNAICDQHEHLRQEIRYNSPDGLNASGLPAIAIAKGTGTEISPPVPAPVTLPEMLPAIDFSELIATYTKNFVGREWLLEKIDAFLVSDDRYLIITGESGIGKTAISAELTRTRSIHAHHFCRARDAETFNPEAFVKSMSSQLSRSLPGFRSVQSLSGTESKTVYDLLEHLLIGPLKTWAKDHHEMVVTLLVDSLDEAETHQQPNIVDLIGVTQGLPPTVRWVLTSRPHNRAHGLPGARETILDSAENNQDDIRKFIAVKLEAPPLAPLLEGQEAKAVALASALQQKCQGNFRYLTHVMAQMTEDASKGLLPEPEQLPQGLSGAYRDFLDRFVGQRVEDLWERKLFPVLQILAVALDSLTLDQIATLSNVSRQKTKQALETLDQFLDPADGDNHAYRIFHTSFTDFLTAADLAGPYWIDPIEAHGKIADVFWKQRTGDWYRCDDYGIRNLPRHFAAAGRSTDLRALLFDYAYLRTRIEHGELMPLLDDFALATDDPEANRLESTLRMSSHVLRRDPNQLPSQLFGRLLPVGMSYKDWQIDLRVACEESIDNDFAIVQKLLCNAIRSTATPWICPMHPCLTPPDDPLQMVLEGHASRILCMAITANHASIISGSRDKTLRMWDLSSGVCISVKNHNSSLISMAITLDDRHIISGSTDGILRTFDIAKGICTNELKGHKGTITSIMLIPGGSRIISGSGDKTIRIWDLLSGKCTGKLTGHTERVSCLAITEDGRRIISGSADKTLRVWDTMTGECLSIMKGHTSRITCLAITEDGKRIISGSADKTLRVWDTMTGECLSIMKGHTGPVTSIALNHTYIISGSNDRTLRIWDSSTYDPITKLKGHTDYISKVELLADKNCIISASFDNTIRIWNLEKCIKSSINYNYFGRIRSIAFSPKGPYLVSGSNDRSLQIWNLSNGKRITILKKHTSRINSIAITSDGKHIISGSTDTTIRVWDLLKSNLLLTLSGHASSVNSLAITPDDSYIISGSDDRSLRIWDLSSGTCIASLEGHTRRINNVLLTNNGNKVVSASADGTIRIWDLANGHCMSILEGHNGKINSISLTRDGTQIVSGADDNTLRLWSITTGRCIATFKGHTGPVNSLAITPDDSYIISGSDDRSLRIWDLSSGTCIASLEGHTRRINNVLLTNNGNKVVSASADRTIRVWDLIHRSSMAVFTSDAPITVCVVTANGIIVAGDSEGQLLFLKQVNAGTTSPS